MRVILEVLGGGTSPQLARFSNHLSFKLVVVLSVLKFCPNALAHDDAPIVRVRVM